MWTHDWVEDYLDKPFEELSYGPDSFDCYGLVWHVLHTQAGIDLPRFDDIEYQAARINAEISRQAGNVDDWETIQGTPQQFDVVVLRRAGESHHVGVWLDVDGGLVLHATRTGVLATSLAALYRMNYRHHTVHRYRKGRAQSDS